MLKTNSTKLHQ